MWLTNVFIKNVSGNLHQKNKWVYIFFLIRATRLLCVKERTEGSKECNETVEAAKYIANCSPGFAPCMTWFTAIDCLAGRIKRLPFYCTIKCFCHEINWEWASWRTILPHWVCYHSSPRSCTTLTALPASIFLTFLTTSTPFRFCSPQTRDDRWQCITMWVKSILFTAN